jgi:hypothetical protein
MNPFWMTYLFENQQARSAGKNPRIPADKYAAALANPPPKPADFQTDRSSIPELISEAVRPLVLASDTLMAVLISLLICNLLWFGKNPRIPADKYAAALANPPPKPADFQTDRSSRRGS